MSSSPHRFGPTILLAGFALLSLLIFLPTGETAGSDPIRHLVRPLFVAGSFALFALSLWPATGRPAAGLPGWFAPGRIAPALLGLTTLLLFRSHDPEAAAELILVGVAALLFYRTARRTDGDRLMLAFLLPAAALAALGGWSPVAATGAGPFGAVAGWATVGLFAALYATLSTRSILVAIAAASAAVVFAARLVLDPTPLRAAVAVLAAAVAAAAAIRNPAVTGSGETARIDFRRYLLISAAVLVVLSLFLLLPPVQDIVLTDAFSVDRVVEWERVTAVIGDAPIGIGPGNLPDALAPDLLPPEEHGDPLTRWPPSNTADLLRLQAEIGWLFLPLWIAGIATLWAAAFLQLSRASGRRQRLAGAALLAAVLAATAGPFLYQTLAHPGTLAMLCLVAARAAAAGSARLPQEDGPIAPAPGRTGRIIALLAVAVTLYFSLVSWRSGRHAEEGARRFQHGQLAAALESSAVALRLRPGAAGPRSLRAAALYAGANCHQAVPELLWLRQRRPGDAPVALQLLDCYDRQGFVREGVRLSQELADTWPDSAVMRAEAGHWLGRDDRLKEAERELTAALDLDMQRWQTKIYLGEVLEKQGRAEEATYLYRGAVSNRPDDPVAFLRLGDIRFRQGKFDRAAQYYSGALRNDPDDPEVLVRTGLAVALSDRRCAGLELLERAIEYGLSVSRRQEINPFLADLRTRCPDPAAAETDTGTP